jgi:hypothetical protein
MLPIAYIAPTLDRIPSNLTLTGAPYYQSVGIAAPPLLCGKAEAIFGHTAET